jgi:alpha-1,2-mannosyltransferase
MWDFYVYEEAAILLHNGNARNLYQGADTGVDPQMRLAAPDTPLVKAAALCGLSTTSFYLYPPLLADLFYPFGYLVPSTAARLWLCLNIAALCVTLYLMLQLLSIRMFSLGSLALALALFGMDSTLFSLEGGQITIMLLLLWTCGIYLQSRGRNTASAICFALAAGIKLTPVLVVLPLLLWKDWRWLRSFVIALAALIAFMFLVNSPAVLIDYVLHVMPAVGIGVPSFENKSIVATIEFTYMLMHGAGMNAWRLAVPVRLAAIAKLIAALPVLATMLLIYRAGSRVSTAYRIQTIALIALLSACISPVSWRHAYILAFPALALLWNKAFRQGISNARLALLAVCTFEIWTFRLDYMVFGFSSAHPVLAGIATIFAPLSGIILVLIELADISTQGVRESYLLSAG